MPESKVAEIIKKGAEEALRKEVIDGLWRIHQKGYFAFEKAKKSPDCIADSDDILEALRGIDICMYEIRDLRAVLSSIEQGKQVLYPTPRTR